MKVVAFTRLAGILVCLAFGSVFVFLELYSFLNAELERVLQTKGELVFVTLDRAQQRNTPAVLGRVGLPVRNRFFFSYSGRSKGVAFQAIEEVDFRFFHLHSEGKNAQARVYSDEVGGIHSQLLNNPFPYGRNLGNLRAFSLYAASLGLVAFLSSLRPKRRVSL